MTDVNTEQDKSTEADSRVEGLVMRDLRKVHDNFTEVIGSALHYYEYEEKVDLKTCTAAEIVTLRDGWLDRYRHDPRFHRKVQSIVARLMQVVDA